MIKRITTRLVLTGLLLGGASLLPPDGSALVRGDDQAYASLGGRWQVVELVDDGRVIAQEAIATWIPCGDQLEVVDNTFVFTSPMDGKKHAKTFSVDATRYPREINVQTDGRVSAHGIYQFDQGRWVICAASTTQGARPTDFSAPQGSRRLLMVLKRPSDVAAAPGGDKPAATGQPAPQPAANDVLKLPPPPDLRSQPGSTGRLLTDAEVVGMLVGTWKYRDIYGDFFFTLDSNGTFNTYRETAKTSVFQQVFVRSPVSSGTWSLNNGQVTFRCTASVQRDRVNRQLPYSVRSISATDLILMDCRGQVAKAVKVR